MKREDIRVLFGLRLRQLRKEAGISQEEMMLETGIHRTYISEVERGLRNISIINIDKIASSLKSDIRELFNFAELKRV
jgi:transcriptional regulator with XRE-family HTH domain